MGLTFEGDSRKALVNLRKHGVAFEEASTVFADPSSITIHDPNHSSSEEERFVTIGASSAGYLVVVVHCDRQERIRIISARLATRRERHEYGQSL
jgi:uncharacterized protein